MEFKKAAFELKELTFDGSFSGYGSVFGNVDQGGDVVQRGAFTKSLNEYRAKGEMPALLWQHDHDQPIGIWTKAVEDDRGLYLEGRLLKDDVRQAAEAYALLKARAIKGLSIGYVTKESSYNVDSDTRTLIEVDLWEVSLVTFAMNQAAGVTSVKKLCEKGLPTIREFENFLRDVGGFSQAQAKAIVADGFKAVQRDVEAKDDEAEIAESLQKLLKSINV
ncbi:HK97 family phage prohead protease [Limnobacter sp.]|uniref:HK97 family phage prohead protease n=1 Tax=Limnobacter sp. TaxID=2003368 RepID=UPI0025C20386|nr:HK97 family phage prohead protease [Limnobacter sp.]